MNALLDTMQTGVAKVFASNRPVTREMFNRDHGEPMLLDGLLSKGYLELVRDERGEYLMVTENGLRMMTAGHDDAINPKPRKRSFRATL